MYFCPYKPIRPVNMKKRFLYSLLVAGMFSLQACQTVEQFSVDYMMPADISFPAELKRVAIVNNMPNVPDNKLISSEETKPKSETEIASRTDYYNGDARIAAESLAESVASHNYFDLVVICDSALRSRDIHPRETTLAQEEVRQLTRELGVDFLISLENIQLKSTRKLEYIPSWRGYYGTVDVKVYPIVRIYLPNRSVPMATVSNTDSIFWEKSGLNEDILGQLVSEKELVEEASAFAHYMANEGAEQCGFCSPGLIMNVLAMEKELEAPGEDEIKAYLAGNLCRCTGYMGQMRAITKYLNRKKEGTHETDQ